MTRKALQLHPPDYPALAYGIARQAPRYHGAVGSREQAFQLQYAPEICLVDACPHRDGLHLGLALDAPDLTLTLVRQNE